MSGNKYIVDSSAWIEYLEATPQGSKVAKIIEAESNEIITPNIVVAEVASKIIRKGGNHKIAINAIRTLSKPAYEEQNDYFLAGETHSTLIQKIRGISLADAIILTLAEKENAKIITKDHHLKGKNTILLE